MSRLSRPKLSARLGNLGLNPEAARPLTRLMSRFSRPYVQSFQTQTLGATMQFGSESGCGVTIGPENRTVSSLVTGNWLLVAPSPPWSGKSRGIFTLQMERDLCHINLLGAEKPINYCSHFYSSFPNSSDSEHLQATVKLDRNPCHK